MASTRPVTHAIVIMAVVVFACGCSPQYAHTSFQDTETLCEQSLQQLDTIIENKADDPSFPPEALAEARELRNIAAELYLDGEIELALEMIDEAFALLRDET